MPDKDDTRKQPASGDDPFGKGLGPDFSSLGRRIVIRPDVNKVKLKRRKKVSREKRNREQD